MNSTIAPARAAEIAAARRLDEACDRFEAAWKAAAAGGPRPAVADYLAESTGDTADLLAELDAIDRHYRPRVGEPVTVDSRSQVATILHTPGSAAPPDVIPLPTAPPGFVLLGELGRGGMGVVYLARQPLLGREVAFKVLRDGDYSSPARRARFLTEAESAAALNHPGIVQVYQFGTHARLPYMALEYCPGGSLADRLASGPLSPRAAAAVAEALANAAQAAHARGVIHRDLKPANVLYSAAGAPKIADFGLARFADGPGLTVTGEVMGTPAYMAPEQAEGKRVTAAADVYSLGAILYECLTGRPPFTGANPGEILMRVLRDEPAAASTLTPGVPRDLAVICHQCLHKEPARRYASAAALEADLRAFLDGRPVAARKVSRAERVWKWAKRYPLAAGMIVAVFLTLTAGTAVSAVFAVKANRRADETAIARDHANAQAAAARAAAVRMFRDRGFLAYKMTDGPEGLLWNAHTLANLPADAADARAEMRAHAGAWATHALPLRHVFPHGGEIRAVAVTRDGSRLAVGGADGVAQIYDAETGDPVGAKMPHADRVWSLAFTPDGKRLVTAHQRNKARVWDAATGLPLSPEMWVPWEPVLAVRPDGSAFVAAGGSGPAVGFSLNDFQRVRPGWEVETTDTVRSVAFSPDGATVALGMNYGDIRFVAWPTAKPARAPLKLSPNPILGLAYAGDGKRLAVAGWLGEAGVWDTRSGQQVWAAARTAGQVLSTTVTGDGHVVFGGGDGSARLAAADGQFWPLPLRSIGPVQSVAADAANRWILTGGQDGYARLWEMRPHAWRDAGRVERTTGFSQSGAAELVAGYDSTRVTRPGRAPVVLPTGPVTAGALSPDGRTALVVTATGKCRFWDVDTASPAGPEIDGKFRPLHVRFSPDGKRAIAWGWTTPLLLLDPAGGRVITSLRVREETPPYPVGMIGAAFSADGRRVFGAGALNTLRTWDAADGRLLHAVSDQGFVYTLAAGPDRVAMGLASNEVILADAATGRQTGGPLTHPGIVWAVALDADDRRLLTACYDGMVRLWDTESGRLVGRPWEGHTRYPEWVAFHPSRPLALSADKLAVRWWDNSGGKPLGPPMTVARQITDVSFTPDGAETLVLAGNVLRRIPMPPALADDPAVFRQWVAVHFGLTVTAENEGVPLTPGDWYAEWLEWRAAGRPAPFAAD